MVTAHCQALYISIYWIGNYESTYPVYDTMSRMVAGMLAQQRMMLLMFKPGFLPSPSPLFTGAAESNETELMRLAAQLQTPMTGEPGQFPFALVARNWQDCVVAVCPVAVVCSDAHSSLQPSVTKPAAPDQGSPGDLAPR